ncbi:MAG: twin-arginine translocase subunit TatC [Muribaculaceae bacterium]|nr:twin-arginine translocase subunit TatC [Muribaculaceae bacterium]
MGNTEMGFWDHVEALRGVLLRSAGVLVVLMAAYFAVMPRLFDSVILAPCRADFMLYGILDALGAPSGEAMQDINLVNINLTSQFLIHMSASFWLAVVTAFPIVIYLLWGFVSPGLYESEKRGAPVAFGAGVVMFFAGAATGYFLVFPLTLRFLADYRLSDLIPNYISIDSYMDTFLMLVFVMGLVFELPVVTWLLGKAGIMDRTLFDRYRRHAIVGLLVLSAVVTPTGDPFTLSVVFVPLYLLWEVSAFTVPKPVTTIQQELT